MRNLLCFFAVLISATLSAQDISGKWNGLLKFPGGQMRIILNIANSGNGYTATMDIPEQGAKDIAASNVAFTAGVFSFGIPQAGIEYSAKLENNIFVGTFKQGAHALPLNLGREEIKIAKAKRPQEPAKPYPYPTEEVTFKNEKAGITLAGTLTLPAKTGSFPAVVLITGSGGQDRNEEIMGHKPFLVLADYLTKNGIAVLRYDDRGIGASGGNFETGTTADFATDAEAAFNYLKTRPEINKKKIGLAGHSEGGTIAPIVASAHENVAFIVMMAGTALPGDEIMMLQNYLLGKAGGMPEEELTKLGAINRKLYTAIKTESTTAAIKTKLTDILTTDMKPLLISKGIPQQDVNQYINGQVNGLVTPWYINFIKYNPASALEKVKCPILALNGEKDLQVAPVANLDAVTRAADKSGNKKVTVKQLPGLNHLFQESATGLPSEYETTEQTMSPAAMNEIATWIKKQVN